MKGTGFGKRSGRNQLNIWTTFTPLFDLVQSLLLGLNYNGTFTIVWHESCPVTNLKAVRSNENVNYWPASHVSISVNGWQNAAVESQQRYSKNRQKSPSTVWRGQTGNQQCVSVFLQRGFLLPTLHSLAWMMCKKSCWKQWVQALLLFILTLFHASEAHNSCQPGQNRLKSANKLMKSSLYFHWRNWGEKYYMTCNDIFLPGKPLQS